MTQDLVSVNAVCGLSRFIMDLSNRSASQADSHGPVVRLRSPPATRCAVVDLAPEPLLLPVAKTSVVPGISRCCVGAQETPSLDA